MSIEKLNAPYVQEFQCDTHQCQIFADDGRSPAEVDQLAMLLGEQLTEVGAQSPPPIVQLTTPPLTYVKRQMERQGTSWPDALLSGLAGERLMRAAQQDTDASMDDIDTAIAFDTSKFALPEIAALITGSDLTVQSPDWELNLIDEKLKTLKSFSTLQDLAAYPTDAIFLNSTIATIEKGMVTLPLISDQTALAALREEIRTALGAAWMSIFSNKLPYFYVNGSGDLSLDTSSQKWRSGFFKMAKAEPVLRTLLQQAHILDPYGGTGEAVNLLCLRGLAGNALSSDISYPGGQPIAGDKYYAPALNADAMELCFDGLPSWYKPQLYRKVDYQTADSRRLPLAAQSVDYIVTDPPYGVECPQGGQELLLQSLPEFLRVARYGAVMLAPTTWCEVLQAAGFQARQLTQELSGGQAAIPTHYLHVAKD